MTKKNSITTLGELKAQGYRAKSIKEELRSNLISNIKQGKPSFTGIHGYGQSVIPQLERAILSQHNINLLGLRGQAKTRLARLMVQLLDEYIPAVKDSEINDDPMAPISKFARDLIAEHGDDTPITWIHREDRFFEKLATPDVTISDLIGDIDPIKAANMRLSYADERVIHFGMIPRANRSIFVINELPDLQSRIQVALFNILEEGDIQEALSAANAVGDDAIQKRSQGSVVPDSFTHGSSEQRMKWFMRGYKTGDIKQGDTLSEILN